MRRRGFLKAAGLCAAGTLVGGCREQARLDGGGRTGRPNILWITCEDISPCLGCYGDPYAMTPNIDRLAAEGVVYEQAYATAPVCAPSRSCLVTGLYATATGTQHLRSDVRLPDEIRCFPTHLRRAGYYCTNNFKKDYNFQDVDVWDESSPQAHWRNRPAGRPFFTVFNFTSTHQGQINGPNEQFNATYRSKLDPAVLHNPAKLPLPGYYPDTPFVREVWARYYDLITYMDGQVGEILNQVQADGLAEDTIVFFYSDHGMGLPRFKRTLYDSGLHVPLIVRLPHKHRGLCDIQPGGRTDRLVSFVDFAPTVLSIAGLTVPDVMQGTAFMGPGEGKPREYVYGAADRVDEAYELIRCVRDRRYKYIRNFMPHLPYIQPSAYCDQAEIMQELRAVAASGRLDFAQKAIWSVTKPLEELYDTQSDPHELVNLAETNDHAAVLNRMRKALRAWLLETRDTGFMPEAEMHIRCEGSTPHETAQSDESYPLERVLAAAELTGSGRVDEMIRSAGDEDAAVRYWAVLALAQSGRKDPPVVTALFEALGDDRPNVRFTAAGALCRMGMPAKALETLATGLGEPREETVLAAAREIQWLGARARPIIEPIRAARLRFSDGADGYKNMNHAMFIVWALRAAEAACEPGPE